MNDTATNEITIVDGKMPFMSMVVFMVKAAIAAIAAIPAIPAVIILAVISMLISGVTGFMFGGGTMMMSQYN
jgi:hypothetical protein